MQQSSKEREVIHTITKYQRNQPAGLFIDRMQTYYNRLWRKFFLHEPPSILLSVDHDGTNRGWFSSSDGLLLPMRININVHVLENGIDAAEVLAHETVHVWEYINDEWNPANHHGKEFHAKMNEIGLITTGRSGRTNFRSSKWFDWLKEVEDLELGSMILPGSTDSSAEFTKRS